MKNSKSSKTKVQKGQWPASCQLFPTTAGKKVSRRKVKTNYLNVETYPRFSGLPSSVLEHTLINCPIADFYNYIDNYEDYFQMARVLAKDGKLPGLRHAYINDEVYELAYEKILG